VHQPCGHAEIHPSRHPRGSRQAPQWAVVDTKQDTLIVITPACVDWRATAT
jgi:hypothetical protein